MSLPKLSYAFYGFFARKIKDDQINLSKLGFKLLKSLSMILVARWSQNLRAKFSLPNLKIYLKKILMNKMLHKSIVALANLNPKPSIH